jgi:broad specificity phosphatase PhoE
MAALLFGHPLPYFFACLFLVSFVIVNALVLPKSFGMSPKQPEDRRDVVSTSLASPSHKMVFAIRHGTSTANEFMRQAGNQWGDPTFTDKTDVDAPLSETGRRQARTLLQQKELFESVDLILVSPLRRCLQTYMEGVHPISEKRALVVPLIRERVYTQSDTSPYSFSELSEAYPSLDWSEALKHDHPWHYTPSPDEDYEEWRPNDGRQWYAVPGEPEDVFEKRMNEFEIWLRRRPESRILLVSHWGVIRHFTSEEAGNCHIVQFKIELENNDEEGLIN